ncbi:hypothetical protein [Atlantibacter hermannii]|uniref:hypothetical protein n=1 Tax=Atlantibacter hermannii TaxID=565 RepID=UPI0035E3E426
MQANIIHAVTNGAHKKRRAATADNGHPVAVVRTLAEFNPQLISHTLSLTARLDSDGYAADFIIHTLAMEGAR